MGKTWLEKPSLIRERSQISQSCEANFSLECMHELNPHWLKVQKTKQKKSSRSFGHGGMQWGSCSFCSPFSPSPRQQTSHPPQTQDHSFWRVPECLRWSITRFFFLTYFQSSVRDFLYPSVPSYPFPENMKNWGKMSPYCPLRCPDPCSLAGPTRFYGSALNEVEIENPADGPLPQKVSHA